MEEEIKDIMRKALSIERWAPKTDVTFPFLDDEEKEEISKNILKELEANGYKIIKEA